MRYGAPAAGSVPTTTFGSVPPHGTSPIAGAPVMPSPTRGRTPCSRIATRKGQPSSHGAGPAIRSPSGSPVARIAYMRPYGIAGRADRVHAPVGGPERLPERLVGGAV